MPTSYSLLVSFDNRVIIRLFVKSNLYCMVLQLSIFCLISCIVYTQIVNILIIYIIIQRTCVYHVTMDIITSRVLYLTCYNTLLLLNSLNSSYFYNVFDYVLKLLFATPPLWEVNITALQQMFTTLFLNM